MINRNCPSYKLESTNGFLEWPYKGTFHSSMMCLSALKYIINQTIDDKAILGAWKMFPMVHFLAFVIMQIFL